MVAFLRKLSWFPALTLMLCGISGPQQQDSTGNIQSLPVSPARQVDPLPTSKDSPVPDIGTWPSPKTKSKSPVKRVVNRLFPVCLDAIVETCWTLADDSPLVSHDDLEFAKDMEIGMMYFNSKNYRGAEFRFSHALGYKQDDPEANFKLAESLDKQNKIDEALAAYQSFLELAPPGKQVDTARKAIQLLEKKKAQASK
jgi:hypothetical protein